MCGLLVEEGARGVVIPHIEMLDASQGLSMTEIRYTHLGCLLSNVGGEGISWEKEDHALGQEQG